MYKLFEKWFYNVLNLSYSHEIYVHSENQNTFTNTCVCLYADKRYEFKHGYIKVPSIHDGPTLRYTHYYTILGFWLGFFLSR